MANGDLVFKRPARGDGLLIFGGSDGPSTPPAELHVDATFPELDASIRIDTPLPDGVHLLEVDAEFPGLDANIRLTAIRIAEIGLDAEFPGLQASIALSVDPVELHVDATLPDLDADIGLAWDANVSRVDFHVDLRSGWQEAQRTQHAVHSAWAEAMPVRGAAIARWQEARRTRAATRAAWQEAERLRHAAISRWQEAARTRAALRMHWQETDRLRHALTGHWQEADARRGALGVRWQEAQRLRHAAREHWQDARRTRTTLHIPFGPGQPVRIAQRHWWQEARRAPPGVSPDPVPPEPPRPEPCYDPEQLGQLVFRTFVKGNGELVFVCWRHSNRPIVVIPPRRVYVTVNDIILRRVEGNIAIPCDTFSMALDEGSWTWTWSATVRRPSLPDLEPSAPGVPVVVEAVINGVPYRLLCESRKRDRAFAQTRVNVEGRGLAAMLDEPYAPTLNFGNAADPRTAYQLMLDALTDNGVSIGWDVDWGLADWVVPAGAWSHQGTYISAINAIAAAAGGYVQPHNTAQTLRILHRYPDAPWDWAGVTPDIELPQDVVSVEGVEWITKPAYDRVFVSGQAGGILAQVTRGGQPGNQVAPMVTDALITHADAARQRGRAELSDTGPQARVSLSLPVLPQTGLILPGTFLSRVDTDNGETLQGIVRGVGVSWEFPKLRQTIDVQCHA